MIQNHRIPIHNDVEPLIITVALSREIAEDRMIRVVGIPMVPGASMAPIIGLPGRVSEIFSEAVANMSYDQKLVAKNPSTDFSLSRRLNKTGRFLHFPMPPPLLPPT